METLLTLEQTLLEKRERLKTVNKSLAEVRNAVSNARNTLNANDYKRHKNVEYAAMGLDLPYSWEDIHRESQALRDIINENEPKYQALFEESKTLREEILILQKEYRARENILKHPLEDIVDEPDEEDTAEKGVVWSFETAGN